jgi:hypothetical protein
MRIDPGEYEQLDLRAHSLLADVAIHDVWAVDLPGGGPGRTVLDVLAAISVKRLRRVTPTVTFLFWLRGWLGRGLGWDRARLAPAQGQLRVALDGRRTRSLSRGTGHA